MVQDTCSDTIWRNQHSNCMHSIENAVSMKCFWLIAVSSISTTCGVNSTCLQHLKVLSLSKQHTCYDSRFMDAIAILQLQQFNKKIVNWIDHTQLKWHICWQTYFSPLLQHFHGNQNSFRQGWYHPQDGVWLEQLVARCRRWIELRTISEQDPKREPSQHLLVMRTRWKSRLWRPPTATIGG